VTQPTRIFLSSRIWGVPASAPGRQHYSYTIARRKFEAALRYLDLQIHDMPRPEIYAAPVSRRFLSGTCRHLIFKPAEWIRLLKDAQNIACIAWEFDKLAAPRIPGPHHPFQDMRRMLMLPDEIWVPCEFTRQVFRAAGITNVHRIPAPIFVPSVPAPTKSPDIPASLNQVPWINLRIGFGRYRDLARSSPSRPRRLSDILRDCYQGRQPLVFLSVLNPHDLRKNLSALVGGFLAFHAENPDSLLLLKLVVDNASDRLDNVLTGILPMRISGFELIDSDAVWLATEFLPEPVLAELYRFSSAYLCASRAEGQNLPLQEAMAWELPPITTRHTAMLDYISEDNAITIGAERRPIDRPDTAMGADPDASWHVATSANVVRALRRFALLDEPSRRELGVRARATIAADYSIAAVARLIEGRLGEHR
jgi:glycosyltransferase involved in cell wall biosynthesis